jgi:hypothetical protein
VEGHLWNENPFDSSIPKFLIEEGRQSFKITATQDGDAGHGFNDLHLKSWFGAQLANS